LEGLKIKGYKGDPTTFQLQPLPFAYPLNPRGSSVLSTLSAVRAQALTPPKEKSSPLLCPRFARNPEGPFNLNREGSIKEGLQVLFS
jgi:hypothetical protein